VWYFQDKVEENGVMVIGSIWVAVVRHQWKMHTSRTDLVIDAARASLDASSSSESPYQWQMVRYAGDTNIEESVRCEDGVTEDIAQNN